MHIASVHEGKRFECDECSFQAKWQDSLIYHRRFKHQGVSYPCSLCDWKAARKNHLKRHMQGHANGKNIEKPFIKVEEENEVSPKSFNKNQVSVNLEAETHFIVEEESVKDDCKAEADDEKATKEDLHKQEHLDENDLKHLCSKCGKEFSQQSHLNIHIKSIHEGKKYDCKLCDFKASWSDIAVHVKSEHQPKQKRSINKKKNDKRRKKLPKAKTV